ncbi:uncharacterized protein LOC106732484 isoform X6 [Pelodiscus sinensis]|uniref:uncharacterized protein LOC106732484 isoform X6 n=1 Tax=Pelodiscus sinensis TaxID=13735 RepID=UPI003F6AB6AA
MEPAGPEPGPDAGPAEIDLSLDDIIKRQRKGQRDAKLAGATPWQQAKNRSPAYGNGWPRFRTWMQRNLQGPNRFRRGFGQQQYNRRQFRSAMAGPRRRAVAVLNGASPLNRQTSPQEGNRDDEALTKSSDSRQPAAQGWLPQRPKRFRTAGAHGQATTGRPFALRRRAAFPQNQAQQRPSYVGFTRGVRARGPLVAAAAPLRSRSDRFRVEPAGRPRPSAGRHAPVPQRQTTPRRDCQAPAPRRAAPVQLPRHGQSVPKVVSPGS